MRFPNRRSAVLAAALLLGCTAAPQPPHVLLVTVDTLRPDYLSANGYDRETTPSLDTLVEGGFYFEQAVAPVARTTPALASLLTGGYPHTTGVRTLVDPLAEEVVPLTELLEARGYQTLAVVTNQVLTPERRLSRGFALYDAAQDRRRALATTDAALRDLASVEPDRPVFAWVHYIDPHVPYHPDPVLAERFDPGYSGRYVAHFGWNADRGGQYRPFPANLQKHIATHRNPLSEGVNAHIRRLYAADIRMLDDQIARLLDGVRTRLGEEVLVIFAADHGESLGEHDFYFDHGDYVYNAGTRVPLAFVLPPSHTLAGTGRCAGWVSLVDVLPTVLELLDIDASELADQMEGRSLTPCMRGEALVDAAVFAESGQSYYFRLVRRRQRNDVAGRFRAVFLGDWKLVWTPFRPDDDAWELYDVTSDPDETRDLYAPDHPAVPELKQRLAAWMARAGSPPPARPMSEADRESLRALGYID